MQFLKWPKKSGIKRKHYPNCKIKSQVRTDLYSPEVANYMKLLCSDSQEIKRFMCHSKS